MPHPNLRPTGPDPLPRALLSDALARVDRDRAVRARNVIAPWSVREPAAAPRRGPVAALAPWQARRVAAHVAANFARPIRVDEMAALTRLTPGYFSRAFRGSFGMPPHAYLVERRLAHACELMVDTDEPLAQVAISCGLYDQAHFTRLFRRFHGLPPGAWRAQRRASKVAAPGKTFVQSRRPEDADETCGSQD